MPKWSKVVNILGVIFDDKCLILFKPMLFQNNSVVLKTNLAMREPKINIC